MKALNLLKVQQDASLSEKRVQNINIIKIPKRYDHNIKEIPEKHIVANAAHIIKKRPF